MRLNAARFDAFLSGSVGQAFAWRKRSACPCASSDSGQPRFDCPLCDGKGHQWAAEVTGMAGHTNQTPQKAIGMFGTYERGDCVLTIPGSSAFYEAGQWDRLRSLASTNPFSEVVKPGLNDKLLGTIVSVSRVFWLNPAGDAVIEGGIPVVAADGSLSWASGAPPAATPYTIEGVRYDEWMIAFPLTSDRNSGAAGLPRKVAARRYDLLGR